MLFWGTTALMSHTWAARRLLCFHACVIKDVIPQTEMTACSLVRGNVLCPSLGCSFPTAAAQHCRLVIRSGCSCYDNMIIFFILLLLLGPCQLGTTPGDRLHDHDQRPMQYVFQNSTGISTHQLFLGIATSDIRTPCWQKCLKC